VQAKNLTSDQAIEVLRAALLKAKRSHYFCEDCWYTCPMHPEGSCNERKAKKCDCGAGEFNAEIDRVLLCVKERSYENLGAAVWRK